MIAEDFHAGFCIGVVGRFEAQFSDAQLFEEFLYDSHEISECESIVCHGTLDLVELC